MSAIARLSLTYFSCFPVQRWLTALAAALFVAGLLIPALSEGVQGFESIVAVLFVLPVVVTAGIAFRALSAPRTYRFTAHFRPKMLGALLLTVALVGLIVAAAVQLWPPAGIKASLTVSFVYIFFWLSALVLGTVVTSGSPIRLAFALPVVYAAVVWLSRGGPSQLATAGINPGLAAASASALLWSPFAAWYMRAKRIRPVNWHEWHRSTSPALLSWGQNTKRSRDAAIRLYLVGHPGWEAPRKIAVLAAGAIAIPVVFWIIGTGKRIAPPPSLLLSVALVPMLLCLPQATQIARRSRLLWLRIGGARDGLFRITEEQTRVTYAWSGAFAVLMIGTSAALFPQMHWATVAWLVLLALASGLWATYLGLMRVRTAGVVDVGAMLALVATGIVAAVLLALPWGWIGAGTIVGVQVIGASMSRVAAKRRWAQIDWRQFQPVRLRAETLGR